MRLGQVGAVRGVLSTVLAWVLFTVAARTVLWNVDIGSTASRLVLACWATTSLAFLAVLVYFLVVRPLLPKPPTTKRCPACAETIRVEALICRFCRTPFLVGADAKP